MKPEVRQLLRNLAIGAGLFVLLGAALWGLWHIVRLPSLTITGVVVTGGETVSNQVVQDVVEEELTGSYMGFIPRSFVATYPKKDVVSEVNNIERIKKSKVHREGSVVWVEFIEYMPDALWCDDRAAVVGSSTPGCFFLDDEGYAFAEAPALSGSSYIRFIQSSKEAELGVFYTNSDTLQRLIQIDSLFADMNWSIKEFTQDAVGDVYVQLSGGSELRISLNQEPEQTVQNLHTILETAEYRHLSPGNFKYIDLRFGNKVFVNEFGEVPAEPAVEDQTSANIESVEQASATPVELPEEVG